MLSSSPAKTKTTVAQKLKQPSVSPKSTPEKNKFEIKTASPKKKLDFIVDDKTTVKTGFKRKNSPTKTPENKKFKINSHQSPDTQVSQYFYLFLLCTDKLYMIKILGKWIPIRLVT